MLQANVLTLSYLVKYLPQRRLKCVCVFFFSKASKCVWVSETVALGKNNDEQCDVGTKRYAEAELNNKSSS